LVIQKGRRSDLEKISALEKELQAMKDARDQLEQNLKPQMDDSSIKMEMKEKGLVITVLAEVLFDSGKATLKPNGVTVLEQVGTMLNDKLGQYKVGIEGHTDTDPISKSNWKSNWELSAGRALTVLHALIDNSAVAPERLNILGYGEYTPVASNDTKADKQLNRRVEIVVYPKTTITKKDIEDFNDSDK
jgi:chemotaxis protein MotB